MTKKIKSIIIDDELANRIVLDSLLKKHCPSIEVIGSTDSVDSGYKLILETSPELVFLDIKMQKKTGFDLLRMFPEVNFNVIFFTAYDQYAIQAFEFNAIDYILKPIDYMKLIKSVNKAENNIQLQKSNNNIIHFIHSIDEQSQLIKNISIHQNDKVHVIAVNEICYIEASRSYSEIITENNQRLISAKPLSDYEELFTPFPNFLRINKSIIVNINYIKEYTKGAVCYIKIKNNEQEMEVSRRKKGEITQFLKNKVSSSN